MSGIQITDKAFNAERKGKQELSLLFPDYSVSIQNRIHSKILNAGYEFLPMPELVRPRCSESRDMVKQSKERGRIRELETAHQERECLATFLGIFSFLIPLSPLLSILHYSTNIWIPGTGYPRTAVFFSLCFSGSPDDHVVNRKPIAWEKSHFSMLLTAGDISQGKTSATQQQKFHTDDINQCLLLVDFGQVLCSSAN